MEEFLIFVVFVILIVIAIVPIVILSKVSSINRSVDYLNSDLSAQNKKLWERLQQSASKEDIKEILETLNEIKEKGAIISAIETPSVVQSVKEEATKPKEPEMPVAVNQILPEPEKQPLREPVTEPVETPETGIVPETLEEPVAANEQQSTEEVPVEEVKEEPAIPVPQEETPPPFAAFARAEPGEKVVVETPPPYKFPPIRESSPVGSNVEEEYDSDLDKNFIERILGDNWLSKVGIVTLVLGIAFFVKYAIDQNWINEVGRVGIGLLTGGIIIGIAHKLKAKYHVFSSILVGGGISVFYITITLAFREYELFSQTVAFAILIVITIFSVILSLLYDRRELAIFSLLGGFASPLMVSTGAGNYIVLFSYIFILNAGMLVVSFVKKWRIIGIICYALTLGFFWTWLLTTTQEYDFKLVTLFAVLFFIQFYLLAIIDHLKTGPKVTAYQVFLILTNNLFVFLACIYVFNDYKYDVRGIITISLAVLNAFVMLALFRKSEVDRSLIYLLIGIVMTFVSLAIPIQLHGHVITMFWAAEAVVLLLLWQKSRVQVFSIGFIIISVLTIISYAIDLQHNYAYDLELTVGLNRIFITGLVVMAAFILNSFLLKKEDPDGMIEIRGFETFSIGSIIATFRIFVIGLTFLVPYLELNYQLERFTDGEYVSSFRYLAMATYITVYIAVLSLIYRKKMASGSLVYVLFFIATGLYAVVYSYLAIELRFDIFLAGDYSPKYFFVHYLSLPAVALVIYLLIRNIRNLHEEWFSPFCWGLVIVSVIILSIEADHTVISLFGNADNYDSLLYDVHTFGYPILWGIIAMVLMIWGLNRKEVVLRKISLIFFGVIIIKFYAYDVWRMSQAGRIVSFIVLGVILLLVSFLQQKIKTLVKADEEDENS
jgi:uncharacterized membrane protein